MKIDWKAVSKSEGYISLKKAMLQDIRKNYRTKEESYTRFNWVICRAKHYAYTMNVPLETILNDWESKRNYCWVNFYGEGRQPKLTQTPTVVKTGSRSFKKYLKEWYKHDPKKRAYLWLEHCKNKGTKSPARWSNIAKAIAKTRRKYL